MQNSYLSINLNIKGFPLRLDKQDADDQVLDIIDFYINL